MEGLNKQELRGRLGFMKAWCLPIPFGTPIVPTLPGTTWGTVTVTVTVPAPYPPTVPHSAPGLPRLPAGPHPDPASLHVPRTRHHKWGPRPGPPTESIFFSSSGEQPYIGGTCTMSKELFIELGSCDGL